MSSAFKTFDTVERLISRIVAGETVFFVGAGFSLDSEPNSSVRLIRRLMARFAAITEQLAGNATALQLREGLRVTFNLGDKALSCQDMVSETTVKQLSQVYYNINDWICSSFTILLRELEKCGVRPLDEIRRLEKQLLKDGAGGKPFDEVPLAIMDVGRLLKLDSNAGKSLFLETMGFLDPVVWNGDPRDPDHQKALDSYGDRIRDRHRVILRLAREGLAPLILTTNFDLLLEGAGRAAGFEIEDPKQTDPAKPPASYDRLLVIAGPTEFFKRGTAYRAAALLKIHGCVHNYREAWKSPETLERYLPSMVFTFREIQNWRRDSWSRDLVSTLLRTRSILLCGYSGADPVVHDTFRNVYEEILANRPPKQPSGGSGKEMMDAEDTRAFFTGPAGKAEFAGLEILRAGSRAAGIEEPPLFGHPNYLPFNFRANPGETQLFPTLDELFVWIYHRTLRRMQSDALQSDLARIAISLLRRNVAPADVEGIRAGFEAQCKHENDLASRWDKSERSRHEFKQITAWTNHFHVALLRELALMETVARNRYSSMRIHEFRSSDYYFALLDRPGWGAWGAVVEMALRRMAGGEDGRTTDAADSIYPVAEVTSRHGEFTKTALVLRGPGGNRLTSADVPGIYRRIHEWQLVAWTGGKKTAAGTPAPIDVWNWAFRPTTELDNQEACAWFGEVDEPTSKSVPQSGAVVEGRPLSSSVAAAQTTRV
jgi:hypothetical protein